jgi:hypothetical protein
MARKIVNRKALREEVEAAEKAEKAEKLGKADEPKKKVAPKKTPTKRASRAKDPADLRKKVFWGVFNQSLKRVATFEFNQKKEADKKAEALTLSAKTPHFVQKVKETLDA